MGDRWKWTSAVLAAALVIVTAVVVVQRDSASSELEPMEVAGDVEQVYEFGDGSRLIIPAGAIASGARVQATFKEPSDLAAGFEPVGRYVELVVTPPDALRSDVRLEFPINDETAVSDLRVGHLHEGRWSFLPVTIEPDRQVASVTTGSFSGFILGLLEEIGDRLVQDFGQAVGSRAGEAHCDGSGAPNWVHDASVTNDANAALRACVRSEGDTLVVEMVNNRPYGVVLAYPAGAPIRFGWSENGFGFASGLYIAPLSRASVGIGPTPPGESLSFLAQPTALSLGLDVLAKVLEQIGIEDRGSLISGILSELTGGCGDMLLQAKALGADVGQLLGPILTCLHNPVREVLLSRPGGISRETAGRWLGEYDKLVADLRTVELVRVANSYAELLRDATLGFGGFNISRMPDLGTPTTAPPATPATTPRPSTPSPASPPPTSPPGTSPPPTSPPPTSPPPTPPAPRTYPAQQGSRGANTFSNPTNASGQGPSIPAMAWVEVSCKLKPATTIPSAYPDGYWYRIASAPWNNQYYAVANTFWNGDVPGQTPYTHNTDWSIPDC